MKLVMYRILSIILLPIGFIFILNSDVSITGHSIAKPIAEVYSSGFVLGFMLIVAAGLLLALVYLKIDRQKKLLDALKKEKKKRNR